ncbi:MAG: hypothetical protein JNG86_09775 [Verrucomicrobiaceae bacterium]|nr:hypothetical protein [Verrucomicrobiaceae bacterium]
MNPEAPPLDDATASLRQEIREWSTGVRVAIIMMLIPPLLYVSWILLRVPSFETIFEDMLGSKEKLPELTKIIVRAPWVILAAFWGVAGLAAFMMFLCRRALTVCIIGLGAFVLLVGGSQLLALALMEPLVQVVKNLSGGQ